MNPKPLTIITADDHPLLLKGLNEFLKEKHYPILGSAQDGLKAMELIRTLNPDIAILDIEMPGLTGLEIAKQCKSLQLGTKIVLITLHKEPDLIRRAHELNIFGYILKELALEEIQHCLNAVAAGEQFFSKSLTPYFKQFNQESSILNKLTPSEIKILSLIAKDLTNKEIGDLLFISHRTVEKHRSNIINKLELEPKTNSLLLWAKEHQSKLF